MTKPVDKTGIRLVIAEAGESGECMIEFDSPSGGKMRIQWKATMPPDGTSLLRSLGGNGRMIQISAQMRVLGAIESVDGRKAVDGRR